MVTADEETQAKEFLKRAEIRTMKKDLLQLREVDSLKERDKIAKIRTFEEQLASSAKAKADKEKSGRQEVLQRSEKQDMLVLPVRSDIVRNCHRAFPHVS